MLSYTFISIAAYVGVYLWFKDKIFTHFPALQDKY